MSLAQECREAVSRHPYILDALREDIVNYRGLARKIKPEIEGEEEGSVDIEAVTTALRRFGEELQEGGREFEKVREVISESRVSLRGNVVSITATEVGDVNPGEGFFHQVQGRDYTTLVVDDKEVEKTKENVEGKVVEEVEDLTCLTVESPEEIAEVPGVLSHMVSRFMAEEINIVDITSCYTETIVVVEKRDAIKALETLENTIENT
ncbi:MAG: ACT domain-containing protein [Halobacteria archaeon]